MSAAEVLVLVEMGASRQQAVKALAKYKEVMEAAEAIFSGALGSGDEEPLPSQVGEREKHEGCSRTKGENIEEGEEGGDEESCYDDISICSEPDGQVDFDPYKGLLLSKDRSVTVIEMEQLPGKVTVRLKGAKRSVEEMSQAVWLRGCAEGNEQSHLFALYQSLTEPWTKCPSCSVSGKESGKRESLLVFFDTVDEYLEYVEERMEIHCRGCKTAHCSACRAPLSSAASSAKGKGLQEKEETPRLLLHCGQLQAVLLGVGLAHVEKLLEEAVEEEKEPGTVATGSEPNKRAKMKPPKASKTKAASVSGNGTGYASDLLDNYQWHASQKAKQALVDAGVCQSLQTLRTFLPTVSRPTPVSSDFLPHVGAIAHLRRRFLPIVSRLLQSDSLVDMSERFELYQEVVAEWFRAFAMHEALVPLLAQPIMLARRVAFRVHRDGSRERHVTYEGSEGPRELAQSIMKQCRTFLGNMERHNKHKKDKRMTSTADPTGEGDVWEKEQRQLERFATSFIGDVACIDRALSSAKGEDFVNQLLGLGKPMAGDANTDSRLAVEDEEGVHEVAAYEAWSKLQNYAECDMRNQSSSSSTSYAHAFEQEIRTTNASGNHKSGFLIAKELAGLQASLPSQWNGSIFLRVDESRIDVLKACIVGPEDSPYQNGLFMFDIFLPATYNVSNPLVKIMTTAHGTVRHNPNLYANGKVCLSLLGTWTGPGWRSGQSTLLQVLISIQSLVMGVKEPALNEPGWSGLAGRPGSLAYTKNCRRQTVAVAMLRHLVTPPTPWEDVIQGHFQRKAIAIRKQLEQWLREDDGRPTLADGAQLMHNDLPAERAACATETNFQRDVTSIKEHLQRCS